MYAKYYNKLCGSKGVPFLFFRRAEWKKKPTQIFFKYPMSQKVGNFYFYDNFSKCRPIFTQFFHC